MQIAKRGDVRHGKLAYGDRSKKLWGGLGERASRDLAKLRAIS